MLSLCAAILTLAHAQDAPGDPPRRFLAKQFRQVHGRRMAYVDVGHGEPIVFLHGNPTSSYLWRNVMPHLESQGRLIAPDLIGMGDSAKLPATDSSRYTFKQQANFLFALLEQLGVKRHVTLVVHDWGGPLGFYWAYLHRRDPHAVKGIAFMETIVGPFASAGRFALPAGFESFITLFRSPAGERAILQDNFFIEFVLPASMLRNLTMREMNVYRRPFRTPGEGRRPMITWPRQIPFNGTPRSTFQVVRAYAKWLRKTNVPKLFIRGKPGSLVFGPYIPYIRKFRNLREASVRGIHFLQEDSPREIGTTVSSWLHDME